MHVCSYTELYNKSYHTFCCHLLVNTVAFIESIDFIHRWQCICYLIADDHDCMLAPPEEQTQYDARSSICVVRSGPEGTSNFIRKR